VTDRALRLQVCRVPVTLKNTPVTTAGALAGALSGNPRSRFAGDFHSLAPSHF